MLLTAIQAEDAVAKWIDPNVNPHRLLAAALTDMAYEKEFDRSSGKSRQE